jgi:3-hydroxymyristoyl/3-hydroxydecanoyl-(acyl carrier protein) dehydratase
MILPPILATRQPSADEVVLELALPADHPAFAGHFPGQPVLPGVVQTDWAIRLGALHLGTLCLAATDFQVKFRRLIEPGPGLELCLRHDRARRSLSFEYRSLGEIASTGRIKLGEPS